MQMNESDMCSLSTKPQTGAAPPPMASQRFVEVNPDQILHIWDFIESRSTSSTSRSNNNQKYVQIDTESFSDIF
ncbi:unnamed protein product [Blepharisma stoltei]|uniref:Uncharacterized protein n=1 Tax=Blepharisma stoltei TaxID=1481888 RepID=A0AAU9IJ96_9CILI|nr:unnamed protein product [Blepharisma stoltei]